jgi:hypothetical protein
VFAVLKKERPDGLYVTPDALMGANQKRTIGFALESQLPSIYWSAAAIPIRHIDRKLADICEMKSKYWVNPEHWDPNHPNDMSIELDRVRKRYRRLLKGKTTAQQKA